ncbi:30S ribosomal protein S17 [Candidatus Peregrinibacteria bacterium]|jgi:small subunit ribosomal protein S17|nr:30S ribosomal protein S17 [Candidatus Peregrinibacteria bacterium]MBT4631630.1 30S ribosomal protein S17 [Candidatus Peregrinibacteria bacterium]MBT5516758.1 30S ribosomal protein S17 [Candidatus Peregrinibacteria bacterium]MBT5823960.1 30S ribosomal protein S17 [Candidatus Peregrinibacteria bacterium]
MRSKKGTVVSKSGNKSIVVAVHTYKQHEKYKKRFRVTKKFHAHDEDNKAQVGDDITIYETKPLSKLKRWSVEAPKAETEAPKANTKE